MNDDTGFDTWYSLLNCEWKIKEEVGGGVIRKPVFSRLRVSDYKNEGRPSTLWSLVSSFLVSLLDYEGPPHRVCVCVCVWKMEIFQRLYIQNTVSYCGV